MYFKHAWHALPNPDGFTASQSLCHHQNAMSFLDHTESGPCPLMAVQFGFTILTCAASVTETPTMSFTSPSKPNTWWTLQTCNQKQIYFIFATGIHDTTHVYEVHTHLTTAKENTHFAINLWGATQERKSCSTV